MPRIAQLDYEAKIQLGDKTRFDAQKSFVTKDIDEEISAIRIAPGTDSPIDVLDADPREWVLDWLWVDWNWDIDNTLNKIHFTENGEGRVATIPDGEYEMDDLLVEMETQMNAVSNSTFSIFMNAVGEISITIAAGKFGAKVIGQKSSLLKYLGIKIDSESEEVNLLTPRVATVRRKVVASVETTDGGMSPVLTEESKTFYVDLFTEDTDYLYSSDQDLIAEEPDIVKYVSQGRSTFLNVHRKTQGHIVDWLDRNGFRDNNGERLDKWAITDREQVRLWSAFMALKIIYQGLISEVGDVFNEKSDHYEKFEILARNRAILDLALAKDTKDKGKSDKDMSPSSWSGTLVRR